MTQRTIFIKLTGALATEFERQREEVATKGGVSVDQFPRDMFINYMLDIRAKSLAPREEE